MKGDQRLGTIVHSFWRLWLLQVSRFRPAPLAAPPAAMVFRPAGVAGHDRRQSPQAGAVNHLHDRPRRLENRSTFGPVVTKTSSMRMT